MKIIFDRPFPVQHHDHPHRACALNHPKPWKVMTLKSIAPTSATMTASVPLHFLSHAELVRLNERVSIMLPDIMTSGWFLKVLQKGVERGLICQNYYCLAKFRKKNTRGRPNGQTGIARTTASSHSWKMLLLPSHSAWLTNPRLSFLHRCGEKVIKNQRWWDLVANSMMNHRPISQIIQCCSGNAAFSSKSNLIFCFSEVIHHAWPGLYPSTTGFYSLWETRMAGFLTSPLI